MTLPPEIVPVRIEGDDRKAMLDRAEQAIKLLRESDDPFVFTYGLDGSAFTVTDVNFALLLYTAEQCVKNILSNADYCKVTPTTLLFCLAIARAHIQRTISYYEHLEQEVNKDGKEDRSA